MHCIKPHLERWGNGIHQSIPHLERWGNASMGIPGLGIKNDTKKAVKK